MSKGEIINKTAQILFEQDFPGIKFRWLELQNSPANVKLVAVYVDKAENLFERLNLNLEEL